MSQYALPNIKREDVLRIVKARAPIIPNEIKRVLKVGDTILLGAILSELASKGLVKISKTKIGGSPFYYDPANPGALEKASGHLNEKDQRTFHLLKQERVLRDDRQDALTRVSLRNIKDFARPLTVAARGEELTYWKYFTVTDAEAERLIRDELGISKPTLEKPETPPPVPEQALETPTEAPRESTPRPTPPPKAATPRTEEQAQIPKEPIDDEFYKKVRGFFDKHDITILEQAVVRKRSEIDFVISLPTPVGRVEYYCKAKQKKRSNDGDLASAKLQGAARSLPAIYLTTGDVTKKARSMLTKEFKGMVLKEL